MISQIFQWNPKIYIKIERISPRAIKKVEWDPLKSWPQFGQFWTLVDCNFSYWADGTNPIMDFDSWALELSSPWKTKKKFFWLLYKKMPFFEILHVNKWWEKNCHNQKLCSQSWWENDSSLNDTTINRMIFADGLSW